MVAMRIQVPGRIVTVKPSHVHKFEINAALHQ